MGCFSYLCSGCGEGINSSSFDGEHCILMLIEDGEVLERMKGQYDSYGRVFKVDTKNLGPHDDNVSQLWVTKSWGDVCELIFNDNPNDGIAAYHTDCWEGGTPKISENDPDQGWNEYQYTTEGEFHHSTSPQMRK